MIIFVLILSLLGRTGYIPALFSKSHCQEKCTEDVAYTRGDLLVYPRRGYSFILTGSNGSIIQVRGWHVDSEAEASARAVELTRDGRILSDESFSDSSGLFLKRRIYLQVSRRDGKVAFECVQYDKKTVQSLESVSFEDLKRVIERT